MGRNYLIKKIKSKSDDSRWKTYPHSLTNVQSQRVDEADGLILTQ